MFHTPLVCFICFDLPELTLYLLVTLKKESVWSSAPLVVAKQRLTLSRVI